MSWTLRVDRLDISSLSAAGNPIGTPNSLPVVWTSGTPAETLKSYVQLYLKEEIRAEALVRNLPAFTRFLPVAAIFHGQVVSVAALARDVGATRTTIAGYLDILEDTLLAFRIPAFEARVRVRERKHPKLYWIDAGLVRAAKGSLGPPSPEERDAFFEGWIAMLLAAYRDLRGTFDELFYWAPAESRKTEVDFLLRRGEKFIAIEVKVGTRFTNDMAAGLQAIAASASGGVSRRFARARLRFDRCPASSGVPARARRRLALAVVRHRAQIKSALTDREVGVNSRVKS